MPQFDVHRFDGGYVVDCQSDNLEAFTSRVVVPLVPSEAFRLKFPRLTPAFVVGGREFVLATHLVAAVDRQSLGPVVASLSSERYAVQTAIDLLTGSY